MDEADSVLIRTEELTKTYWSGGSELVVFAGINIEVARGERLALVGESGAGKSTLLHLIGGLDRPTSGRIFFEQQEVTTLSDERLAEMRNRSMGFVWQIHYLLPEFSALENVMMPLLIRGCLPDEAAKTAAERLDEVGLKSRVTHRAGELSGGEQQRVVLARALAGSPKLLLADEPTGNLDYKTGEAIMDLIEDLQRSHGLTAIFVTHNLEYARRCDRVLRLDKGKLTPSTGRPALERIRVSFRDGSPNV
jgi:lipoprotein-releasing system ATP-binding protein